MIKNVALRVYQSYLTNTKAGLDKQIKEVKQILSTEGQLRLFYEVQDLSEHQIKQTE